MEGVQSWGAHIGCSSTADNLFIDGMVTCHNLSMAWISVYHGWLKGVMLLHRFSVWLCRLITAKLCRSWNTRVMFVTRKREGNLLTNSIQQRVAPGRCAMPKSIYCMLKPNRVEGQCYRGINIQGLFQKLANEGQMGPVLWFLRGPFSRKGVQERGYLDLLVQTVQWENKHLLMLCCHFWAFWATEKAWPWITAESWMFVWWNNEKEKGNWDSKRL